MKRKSLYDHKEHETPNLAQPGRYTTKLSHIINRRRRRKEGECYLTSKRSSRAMKIPGMTMSPRPSMAKLLASSPFSSRSWGNTTAGERGNHSMITCYGPKLDFLNSLRQVSWRPEETKNNHSDSCIPRCRADIRHTISVSHTHIWLVLRRTWRLLPWRWSQTPGEREKELETGRWFTRCNDVFRCCWVIVGDHLLKGQGSYSSNC